MAAPNVGVTTTLSTVAAASGTTSAITTASIGSSFLIFIHSSVFNGTHSVSDNKGNTYTNLTLSGINEAANGDMVFVFSCINGAGGAGHTFTIGATLSSGTFNPITSAVIEVQAGATSSALDLQVCNAQTGAGSTAVPISHGTTANANELILSWAGGTNTGGGTPETISASGVYTTILSAPSGGFSNSYIVTSIVAVTTGTYGDTFTGSIADAYLSATISINPTSGGSVNVAPIYWVS